MEQESMDEWGRKDWTCCNNIYECDICDTHSMIYFFTVLEASGRRVLCGSVWIFKARHPLKRVTTDRKQRTAVIIIHTEDRKRETERKIGREIEKQTQRGDHANTDKKQSKGPGHAKWKKQGSFHKKQNRAQ